LSDYEYEHYARHLSSLIALRLQKILYEAARPITNLYFLSPVEGWAKSAGDHHHHGRLRPPEVAYDRQRGIWVLPGRLPSTANASSDLRPVPGQAP